MIPAFSRVPNAWIVYEMANWSAKAESKSMLMSRRILRYLMRKCSESTSPPDSERLRTAKMSDVTLMKSICLYGDMSCLGFVLGAG